MPTLFAHYSDMCSEFSFARIFFRFTETKAKISFDDLFFHVAEISLLISIPLSFYHTQGSARYMYAKESSFFHTINP